MSITRSTLSRTTLCRPEYITRGNQLLEGELYDSGHLRLEFIGVDDDDELHYMFRLLNDGMMYSIPTGELAEYRLTLLQERRIISKKYEVKYRVEDKRLGVLRKALRFDGVEAAKSWKRESSTRAHTTIEPLIREIETIEITKPLY